MKKKAYTLTCILLMLIFLLSGALLVQRWAHHRRAQQDYEQAQSAAEGSQSAPGTQELPPEEPEIPVEPLEERAEYLYQVNLDELRQTNPDVIGWISIPGTPLDYPILQGTDNDYYLNRTWQGSRSALGSIFMDFQCSADFSGFNTILYGHNMKNGTMFGSLKKYRNQSYYDENPCVYIVDDQSVRRYSIFAALEAEVVRDTYRLDLDNNRKREAFFKYTESLNVLQTEVVPTDRDTLITLSTCTGKDYDHRWVVQAVLTGTFQKPEPPEQPKPLPYTHIPT